MTKEIRNTNQNQSTDRRLSGAEVKGSGYKKTKLGWIPKEWEIARLGEVSTISGEYGINAPGVEFNEKLPKYLRITDINDDGTLRLENMLSVNDSNSDKYILENDDIVLARTGASVGKAYRHDKAKYGDLVFAGFLIRFRLNPKLISSSYLHYFLQTNKYWNWIHVMSQRSGQPGINGKEYSVLPIPLPPLHEQQKIATILSTWDKCIALQTELIAAKELQKKGLMQQLLTGKVRLRDENGKRFEGEWKEVKLGEVAKTFSGGTPKSTNSDYYNGNIPWISSGELNQITISKTEKFISQEGLDNSAAKIVEPNTLLIAMYGATAGVTAITEIKGAINQAVLAVIPKNGIDIHFLFQLITSRMPYVVYRMVQGGQPNLSGGIINSVKLKLPTIKEQQKIAAVLSAADREIALLKQELVAFEQQKKGLMQVLLMGEVRVPSV